jgi:hypothetical protein
VSSETAPVERFCWNNGRLLHLTCYDGCIVRLWKLHLGLPLVLTFVLGSVAGSPLLAQDDEINWLGDYREAVRQAKATHKPIFLEFRCEA